METDFVKVALRSRPILDDEINAESCLEFPADNRVVVGYEKAFSFDYAFDDSTTQETVYDACGSQFVQNFLDGLNSTIFAYGQTGSGKTFTMGTDYNSEKNENRGIIPRVLKDIFATVKKDDSTDSKVTICFFEIYNEEIFDLLSDTRNKVKLHDQGNFVILTNIREVEVASTEEALECLKKGSTNRTTGATALNNCSSRSHTIFTINLRQTDEIGEFKSSFHLVDLAGSEAVKKAQTTGQSFREGVNINLGLMNLTKVIAALSQKKHFISYRDSVLTQVLKDSLNGNGKILMIACVSPASDALAETVNTMRYAQQASQMRVKPISAKIFDKENNPFRKQLDSIPPTPANRRDRLQPMVSPACHSTPLERVFNSTIGDPVSSAKDRMLMPPPPRPVFDNVSPVNNCNRTSMNELTSLISPIARKVDGMVKNQVSRETLLHFGNELLAKLHKRMSMLPPATGIQMSPFKGIKKFDPIKRDVTTFSSPLACRTNLPLENSADDFRNPEQDETRRFTETATIRSSPSSNSAELFQSPRNEVRKRGRPRKSTAKRECKYDLRPSENLSPSDVLKMSFEDRHVRRRSEMPKSNKQVLERHTARIMRVLNAGSKQHLQCLPTIGPKTASVIHTWRSIYGPFESLDDLKKIKGLPKKFANRFLEANILL